LVFIQYYQYRECLSGNDVKTNGEQAQRHEGIEGRGEKDVPILES
jgi:hypothetical protein